MKRHKYATLTSELDRLDYIMRFEDDVKRVVRIPAPLVFDISHRNGYRFTDTQFDEIMGRYQFHDPTEGVVPDEEERLVYPPAQEETVTPWVKGLPLGGAQDLLRGRIPRLRCMHAKVHTTHGR